MKSILSISAAITAILALAINGQSADKQDIVDIAAGNDDFSTLAACRT